MTAYIRLYEFILNWNTRRLVSYYLYQLPFLSFTPRVGSWYRSKQVRRGKLKWFVYLLWQCALNYSGNWIRISKRKTNVKKGICFAKEWCLDIWIEIAKWMNMKKVNCKYTICHLMLALKTVGYVRSVLIGVGVRMEPLYSAFFRTVLILWS